MNYDCIVIGAGWSGLLLAAILAKEGKKVCVLEAHHLPGGYLQTFVRDGCKFDTGFHYLGGFATHRPLGKYLQYLGLWDKIPVAYYPQDRFFRVSTASHHFDLPCRYDVFMQRLREEFVAERAGLDRFERCWQETVATFPWYRTAATDPAAPVSGDGELVSDSIHDWLCRHLQDPWLIQLLGSFAVHLGVPATDCPAWKYWLCLDSIFDMPVWVQDGGDGLVMPLYRQAQDWGAQFQLRTRVDKLVCEKKRVTQVITANGQTWSAEWVIAAIHPKRVAAMLGQESLTPLFYDHIMESSESPGSLALYLSLHHELTSIEPINYLCLLDSQLPAAHDLYHAFYFHSLSRLDSLYQGHRRPSPPRLVAVALVDASPFMPFRDSRPGMRPAAYRELKERYTAQLLADLTQKIPDLAGNIRKVFASTPLTNEYYTGNVAGGIYGIRHDLAQQGLHRLQSRCRIKNLLFAGHSIHLPGINGVAVNAFATAACILGQDYLWNKVLGVGYHAEYLPRQ